MRKILLLRGVPGCGKSTFIREHKLEPYTLSPDTLRLAHGGPVYTAAGTQTIPQTNDKTVWQLLYELMEKRMQRGELLVIDATHTHPRSFSNYQRVMRSHNYQVICVDFSDVPFEVCMERNQARESFKVVPPKEMARMYDNMQRTVLPDWLTVVKPGEVEDVLRLDRADLTETYKAVHHIGDLQGCFDPLKEYFETYGIHDDELYVFVGDFLDRGPQNVQVLQWLLENYQRRNFVFVEGNHEAHLRNWTRGLRARSREFNEGTLPQLESAGIAPKKVYGLLYRLRDVFYYTFHGRTVVVTHGGLSVLPEKLALVPSHQLIRGMGLYEEADDADAAFAASAPPETYQVHGHRNRNSSPTRVNERCFNLEGKVEFGGELRTVTLTKDGFEERPVKSALDATHTIIEPVGDLPGAMGDVGELLRVLRGSNDIYEKPQDGTHISSFNFKRDVFYKKSWDHLNVYARGLFINTAQQRIVARSYEKFFNVGERPETQPDVLAGSLKFPVRAWVKENGYLGLVGYDPETDALVFASKSSLTSEFAGWLKEQFEGLLTPRLRRDIQQYLSAGSGRTLVFEVIEPQRDPHIISYDKPRLVLLDIVQNTVRFAAESQEERERIAKLLGCETKQLAAVLEDAQAFSGWHEAVKDFGYKLRGEYIEGFVLEDADGFMVKVKLPWYGFWRQMRTQLEQIQRGKKPRLPSLDINNAVAEQFLLFLAGKELEQLQTTSIVALREEFERSQLADAPSNNS